MALNASAYGDSWADIYDSYMTDRIVDPTDAVEMIVEIARGGTVLELGVGTGRLAIPLALRGLSVEGVEASEAMILKLREKPRGAAIPVIVGDYSNFSAPKKYSLVVAAFNAILMLPSFEDQMKCFESVSKVLETGGRFLVEAELPDLSNFVDNTRIHLSRITDASLELRVTLHRRNEQLLLGKHIWLKR